MEASVKLARALEIAGRARIRRRTAAPSDAASERVAPSSERPSALRDSQGRFLKAWWSWQTTARCFARTLHRRLVCDLEETWSAGDQTTRRGTSCCLFPYRGRLCAERCTDRVTINGVIPNKQLDERTARLKRLNV